MNSTALALDALEPISLDEINRVAELQTRVDRKYLVDEPTLLALVDSLAADVRVLEVGGRRTTGYRSTYFDTDDLRFFRAAVQGRRRRYKVRTRTYGDCGPCMLEIKSKGRRGDNVKSRMPYDRVDAGHLTIAGRRFVDEAIGSSSLGATLRPTLTTAYERITFVDPNRHTRITIDSDLRCDDIDPTRDGKHASLDAIVVETKSTREPSAADRWLWANRCRPTKISKYCTGLTATRSELPDNHWHTVLTRHWRVVSNTRWAPTAGGFAPIETASGEHLPRSSPPWRSPVDSQTATKLPS